MHSVIQNPPENEKKIGKDRSFGIFLVALTFSLVNYMICARSLPGILAEEKPLLVWSLASSIVGPSLRRWLFRSGGDRSTFVRSCEPGMTKGPDSVTGVRGSE